MNSLCLCSNKRTRPRRLTRNEDAEDGTSGLEDDDNNDDDDGDDEDVGR